MSEWPGKMFNTKSLNNGSEKIKNLLVLNSPTFPISLMATWSWLKPELSANTSSKEPRKAKNFSAKTSKKELESSWLSKWSMTFWKRSTKSSTIRLSTKREKLFSKILSLLNWNNSSVSKKTDLSFLIDSLWLISCLLSFLTTFNLFSPVSTRI